MLALSKEFKSQDEELQVILKKILARSVDGGTSLILRNVFGEGEIIEKKRLRKIRLQNNQRNVCL